MTETGNILSRIAQRFDFTLQQLIASRTLATQPKAYSYIRMSTEAQLKGDSLRRQLDLSTRFAAEHDLELATDFELQDLGVSAFKGKNAKVGALGQFLAAVRDGKIHAGSYLLVESLDRISRQEIGVAMAQLLDITRTGIIVVTLADRREYRANAKFEDLIYSMAIMSRAHEESAIKSHRVGAAWANKRKNIGRKKLTARCPGWLKLSPDKASFAVLPERKKIIDRIFDDAIAGMGAYSIASRLNLEGVPPFVSKNGWHQSTINKILTNRAVVGEFQPFRLVDGKRVRDGEPVADYFPPIIQMEKFLAAQEWRAQRRTSGGGRRGPYISNIFSKIARCEYCKGPMRYENKGDAPRGGGPSLVCDTAIRGRGCHAVRWKYRDFEVSFLSFVEEVDLGSFFTTTKEAAEREASKTKIASLAALVRQAETERDNAYSLLQLPDVNVQFVADKMRHCEERLLSNRKELQEAEAKLQSSIAMSSAYHQSRGDLKDLVLQVADRLSPDTYKKRAQIASRLQSVVMELTLAMGHVPQGGGALFGRHNSLGARYFTVKFRDGSSRMVYPCVDDAFSFKKQYLTSAGDQDRKTVLWIRPFEEPVALTSV